MEASALPASVGLARARLGLGAPLLRLRSDEQLVSLFRAGNEDAFRVIHDRYRARMYAYARQMLSSSAADPEDAVQEIFVRAYAGLRANRRDLALRAWLYRIAHNRCIDDLRRPAAVAVEEVESLGEAGGAQSDPHARVEQREALRRLIADVQRLPDQQRSALLMRELGGMPYADLAGALGVSVPAVKSLLVRARVGLVQASEARDTACGAIREDLIDAHDRGVRASGRARRHMRDCPECRRFRTEVHGTSRRLGLLLPALGPLGVMAKLVGFGGLGGSSSAAAGSGTGAAAASGTAAATGGGAAASGSAAVAGGSAAAAGGTAAVAGGTAATIGASSGVVASAGAVAGAGAGHVATILAATAIAAGGAIGIQHEVSSHPQPAGSHHAYAAAMVPSAGAAPAAARAASPATTQTTAAATGTATTAGTGASTARTGTGTGSVSQSSPGSGTVTKLSAGASASAGSSTSTGASGSGTTSATDPTSTDPTTTTTSSTGGSTTTMPSATGTITDPTSTTSTTTPIPGSGTQPEPTTPVSSTPTHGNPGTATGIVPTVSSATTWGRFRHRHRRAWRYTQRGVAGASSIR